MFNVFPAPSSVMPHCSLKSQYWKYLHYGNWQTSPMRTFPAEIWCLSVLGTGLGIWHMPVNLCYLTPHLPRRTGMSTEPTQAGSRSADANSTGLSSPETVICAACTSQARVGAPSRGRGWMRSICLSVKTNDPSLTPHILRDLGKSQPSLSLSIPLCGTELVILARPP